MKNKHLVLLFLATLLVGLAVRRAPWRDSTFFQTNLLKLNSAEIQQVQITLPEQQTLFLLRGDTSWSVEQAERSVAVPSAEVLPMLEALADMRSIRIVKTRRPDTLGFTPGKAIQVSITLSDARQEVLSLGWETLENAQPTTFVHLPQHEGIYLVNNHLRNLFTKKLSDFRNSTIARFSPNEVLRFEVSGKALDTLAFQKNDSSGVWESERVSHIIPDESVQIWLTKIARIHGLRFADLFDDSHINETTHAQIRLQLKNQPEPLVLRIYYFQWPVTLEKQSRNPEANSFVIHSSQNPTNYFELTDTSLLRQICQPF